MPTADLVPLGSQQASQHPRAGAAEFQMHPCSRYQRQGWRAMEYGAIGIINLIWRKTRLRWS